MSNESEDIIPAGIQIVCSRKNHGKTGGDRRGDSVIDPIQRKFYDALVAQREEFRKDPKNAGKNPPPMFRAQLMHWDDDGSIKVTQIAYQTLSPDNVALFADIMSTRMAPPRPRGRVGAKDDDAGTTEPKTGSEADDEARAASAEKEASEKAEADKKAAADKAEADKKKAAADKAAADKAEADKKKAAAAEAEKKPAAAAAAPAGKEKSAGEKAREAAAEADKKAKEVVKETQPEAKKNEDFDHLFED